jgi:rod shape determining protein RodA
MSIRRKKATYDWVIILCLVLLSISGVFMIYASEFTEEIPQSIFSLSSNSGKQLLWLAASFAVFLISLFIDTRFWRTFAYPIYFLAIALLVAVLLFGTTIKGATSWFTFGGFSFQPSEYAKFATAIALASYLSYFKTKLKELQSRFIAIGIFILPIILILLQPDAGSAIVFLSFFLVLFRAGLNPLWYIVVAAIMTLVILSLLFNAEVVIYAMLMLAIAALSWSINNRLPWIFSAVLVGVVSIVLFLETYWLIGLGLLLAFLMVLSVFQFQERRESMVAITWPALIIFGLFSFGSEYAFEHFLSPHQQDRINVWLKPQECDPRGSLYNVLQSKMAIGSGGLEGKGYLKGTMTQFNYVPEQSTDFIFCTIGEEFGFLGSFLIIVLFFVLILRITIIAERMRTPFEQHYAYGIAGILFVHVLINVGMTMGLVPIIGIPLPFVSYGGSSLLMFSLMMGVLLKFHRERLSY